MSNDQPTPRDDAIAWRILCDAFHQAAPRYWERRAQDFEAARPRPGDHHPPSTAAADVARHHQHLTAIAAACRRRGTNPHVMDSDELWIAQTLLPQLPPATLFEETTTQMIARHRRIIAALTTPQVGTGAAA